MHPSIDHSLLSPNGRVSKRARASALAREAARLFPPGYWDEAPLSQAEQDAQRAASLRGTAKTLRDLAARGMHPRKYVKEADRLEAEANALVNRGDEECSV